MKTSIKVLACLAFICTSITTLTAQTSSDEFSLISGKFRINLPEKYTEHKTLETQISDQWFILNIYKWQTQVGQFSIAYGDCDIDIEAKSQTFLKDFRSMYLSRLGISNAIRDTAITLGNQSGIELITEAQDVRTVTRVFLNKNRIYLLTLTLTDEQQKQEETAQTILSSFRLLTPEDMTEQRERVAKAFAPEPLPQEPFADKLKSDIEDRNLKGKVKQVLVEEEYFHGENLFGNRRFITTEDFNERGYIVKKIEYYNSLPDIITVYGYLNKERIAKEALKAYDHFSVKVGDDKIVSLQPGQILIRTYQLYYKYNSTGRLEEEVMLFQADGKTRRRVVYKYKDNKLETSIFVGKDKIRSKFIASLDEKGNAVEETYLTIYQIRSSSFQTSSSMGSVTRDQIPGNTNPYGRPNPSVGIPNPSLPIGNSTRGETINLSPSGQREKAGSKYTYTYEFDSQGNWIKRVMSETVKKGGKTVSSPVKVTYRTIAYY